MLAWLLVLGFAVSSSLDNLGVGISYGIRDIRIGVRSNLMIAFICFVLSLTGIVGGHWLSRILPGMFPVLVSAFLLIVVGIRIVLLAVPRKQTKASEREEDKKAGPFTLLQQPELADADRSGEIGLGEAVLLGVALSANAVTNGLGAGLLGLSPLAISVTAAAGSFLTVWLGVSLGRRAVGIRIGSFTLGQFGTAISGILLVWIAVQSLLG